MRRAVGLALALTPLVLVTSAFALPKVAFSVHARPIPQWPATGNIAYGGADLEGKYTIAGSEYAGAPAPLIAINLWLARGVKIHASGFRRCPLQTLEAGAPQECPRGSRDGPAGVMDAVVGAGQSRVTEVAALAPFFGQEKSVLLLASGGEPTPLSGLLAGTFVDGGKRFGPELKLRVPLLRAAVGVPFGSITSIEFELGYAVRAVRPESARPGKKRSYITMPVSCPQHFLLVKSELIFAKNGDTSKPERVERTFRERCPRSPFGLP